MVRTKRIGIVDVAKHLGLSSYTVSRALNGHRDVGAATRERVVAAARSLGYTPNWLGQRLRRNRTDLIGFFLTPSPDSFVGTYFSPVLSGIDAILSPAGYSVVVAGAGHDSHEIETLQRFVDGRLVDAVVLTRVRINDPRIAYLREKEFPFVTLGRDCAQPGNVFVDADHRASGRRATELLIEHGHRRIALINTPMGVFSSQERREAWMDAMRTAGADLNSAWDAQGDYSAESGKRAARQLLSDQNPPTAIICGNDEMALGAISVAKGRGLVVGRDVSVIGCDDIPFSALVNPPITTFRTALREFGELLANQLIALLDGTEPESHLFVPELIMRDSVGPLLF